GKAWICKDRKACVDLTEELNCAGVSAGKADDPMAVVTASDGTHKGVSKVHPVHLLPQEFVGLGNGHNGSHQFLVHDFVTACVTKETPPNNVWQAARYLVPGLIAHESAMKGGVLMEVPDFGEGR
ncbi:MAG: gfo/Idh/MocA family oxidoreductase, partial [bacterium]|nr:gfo/Idh/MocA family oxidoreductase [bacterium]